jgi:hypothetical protein
MEAEIDNAGGQMMGTARVRVWGLKSEEMQQFAVYNWKPQAITRNSILVTANDSVVFYGIVQRAQPIYDNMPDVFLYIEAQVAHYDQFAPVPALSYQGAASVSVIMQQLATTMGMAYENNGVTAVLSNPYLPGTTLEKARNVAKAAGIDMYLDNKTLAICPRGMPRNGATPVVTPATGLIKYPMMDRNGVTFEALYNPALRAGGRVELQSDFKAANGVWHIYSIAQRVSCLKPGGLWMTIVRATEGNNLVINR